LRDTRRGHRLLIELAWQNLRELERKYDDECRDDEEKCDDKVKKAVAAASAVTAAYAAYRIARLLPSLAIPPLWPTIPLNVVIP
jgi:Toxin with a conserved tryptophan and TIP tripeptide motif